MHSRAIASLRLMDWVIVPRYEGQVALSARGYVSTCTMLHSGKTCFCGTNNHLGGPLEPQAARTCPTLRLVLLLGHKSSASCSSGSVLPSCGYKV